MFNSSLLNSSLTDVESKDDNDLKEVIYHCIMMNYRYKEKRLKDIINQISDGKERYAVEMIDVVSKLNRLNNKENKKKFFDTQIIRK